jgi:beta-lactamase regulating signal transducer with metallopeptidase domain
MTAIDAVLAQPMAQAIGWALAHFLWQGALIAAITGVLLFALRSSAADVRYVVATIGLTLMLTTPTMTAVQTWRAADSGRAERQSGQDSRRPELQFGQSAQDSRRPELQFGRSAQDSRRPELEFGRSAQDSRRPELQFGQISRRPEPRFGQDITRWIPVLLVIWICGVGILTLRLVSGWLYVQRLKTRRAVPAGAEWMQMLARLSRRLHISRSIRLLESSIVEVPTVIGWMKPVILLPASALAGLSPEQLEAILAHELAHIRRHDYLVNLLQTLVETLLFYHPAVWWLSHRIRIERENCCDDLAVSLCGDPCTYASALADLEEMRGSRQFVLAATGGSLLHRVRRLLGAPATHVGRSPGWLAGGVAVLLMVAITIGALGSERVRARAEQQPVATTVAPAVVPPVPQPTIVRTSPVATTVQPSVTVAAPATTVAVTPVAVASTATSTQENVSVSTGRRRGNYSWSNNGDKLEVSYEGDVEFTDDDSDVKRLSPGGFLKLSDGGWFGGRGVEFRADASGNITRRFRVGIVEKPYEPEGRAWLSRMLPRFIRQTGIGAEARVVRIMKAKGPAGVLGEVTLIDGSWAKRIYLSELLKTPSLDPNIVRQALTHAGREIDGDYELAQLLIGARHLLAGEATQKAYFDAARSIQGDYELHRVLSAGLKAGPVSPALLASILVTALEIQGDYEMGQLLQEIAKLQPLDATTRRPFFMALETVGGAYERGRVLQALTDRGDLSPDMLASMLQISAGTRSDYEQAQFLARLARQRPIDATLRVPFFSALDTVSSSYERGRVLQVVAKRPDVPMETVVSVLRSARDMPGNYERMQVLIAVASTHALSGAARDAYMEAAAKLGEYEQGQVYSALVRSERRVKGQ